MTVSRQTHLSALRAFSSCLVALVLLLETSFQTAQFLDQRANLANMKIGQDQAVMESSFQRSALEKLVQATLNLARDGDRNVLPVIEQLKKIGIVKERPKP
jgi:hypothetical protein